MEAQPSDDYSGLPCDGCPEQLLLRYMHSPLGMLIGTVLDYDCAMQLGFAVPLDRIPYPVFLLLRQLGEERVKFHEEESKRKQGR